MSAPLVDAQQALLQGYADSRFAALVDHCERLEREWIDPQRIVELAKRYTDQDRIGYVELAYYDHDDREPQWRIIRSGGAHEDARTANDALKMME